MARSVGHGNGGPFAAAVLSMAMLTMGAGMSAAQEKAPPSVPEANEQAPPPAARRGTAPGERVQPMVPGCPFKERKLELIV